MLDKAHAQAKTALVAYINEEKAEAYKKGYVDGVLINQPNIVEDN